VYNTDVFYRFPFESAGFTQGEWNEMPRGNKMIIKQYYLNDRDDDQTALYAEYETMHQVWRVKNEYNMDARPDVRISFADFNIVA